MRAQATLKSSERVITSRMGKIEIAVNAMRSMAEYALDDPDAMYDIANSIVESNNRILVRALPSRRTTTPRKGTGMKHTSGTRKAATRLSRNS